jgi:hypothetical protein
MEAVRQATGWRDEASIVGMDGVENETVAQHGFAVVCSDLA